MQKINKYRKKLQLGDIKKIRSYHPANQAKTRFFNDLKRKNKLKKPY